jgi:hypothetical protein
LIKIISCINLFRFFKKINLEPAFQGRAIEKNDNSGVLCLLLISGSFGMVIGLQTATWQAPIEGAQFLLGWVKYDRSSIEYYLLSSVYSFLNIISVFFLAIKKSEVFASIAISMLLGMIAMQVISMIIYLAVKDVIVSVIFSLLVWKFNLFPWGVSYPIYFMGTPHAYGRAALFLPLYGVLLYSLLNKKIGIFILGLLVGIHSPTGVWSALCFLMARIFQCSLNNEKFLSKENIRYVYIWLIGALISIFPLLIQKYLFVPADYEVIDLSKNITDEIFNNYIKYWDYHRRKVDEIHLIVGGIVAVLICLGTCIKILTSDKFLLKNNIFYFFVAVSAGFSIPLVFFPSWVDPKYINPYFQAFMPGRYINIALVCLMPILISLLINWRPRIKSLPIFLALFCISVFLCSYDDEKILENKFLIGFGALLTSIFLINLGIVRSALSYLNKKVKAIVCISIIFVFVYLGLNYSRIVLENFTFRKVAIEFKGSVLVTMNDSLFQIKNRIPSIKPHLDGYPYLGSSIVLRRVDEFAGEIFGIPLKSSPRDGLSLHRSSFELKDYASTWESRDCKVWGDLASKYNIGLIRVPSSINLKLPVHSEDKYYREYLPICIKS